MKRLFIISAVFLIVVLIFLGIYNFAFKKNSPESAVAKNKPVEITPAKTEVLKQKIHVLSDQTILGPMVNKTNSKLTYYSASDGTVWESGLDGSGKKMIENKPVSGVKSVLWSPDGRKTLTGVNNSSGQNYFEYDHTTLVGKALKGGTDLAVWNNDGSKIIYKYFDSMAKSRSLNAADPDGSNWNKLTDLDFEKISIASIPQTSLVAFWNYPNAKEETKLQTVGLFGGDVKTIFSGKLGADYLWAPDGKKAAVSSVSNSDGKTPTLGVVSQDGSYQDLNIPTLVSKSVWSKDGKNLYYALPGGIPDGAILPDDYQQKKFTTSDTFWKVDTETGIKERVVEVAEIKESYDASQMLLSSTENILFFVNRTDGKLYGIDL